MLHTASIRLNRCDFPNNEQRLKRLLAACQYVTFFDTFELSVV